MKTAEEFLTHAAGLVGGDRAKQHGTKDECFSRMATLLNAYVSTRRDQVTPFTAVDAAHIMVLWKMARTQTGSYNPDDWVDMAGYSGCAAELAAPK